MFQITCIVQTPSWMSLYVPSTCKPVRDSTHASLSFRKAGPIRHAHLCESAQLSILPHKEHINTPNSYQASLHIHENFLLHWCCIPAPNVMEGGYATNAFCEPWFWNPHIKRTKMWSHQGQISQAGQYSQGLQKSWNYFLNMHSSFNVLKLWLYIIMNCNHEFRNSSHCDLQ